MVKEKINVEELFEKYRPIIDTLEIRKKISGWNTDSLVEEYMEEEGYGHGVTLFFDNINVITDGEFKVESVKDRRYPSDVKYDTSYKEMIILRSDGKFFKIDEVCEEYGEYSEEMIEVIKKTKVVKKTSWE